MAAGGCVWVRVGTYVWVGGWRWVWVVVGVRACSWGHLNAHTCAHVCTCVHVWVRTCVCTVRVRVGEGGGEFVLVVGCICVDGWWLRRGLSSLYLQRRLRSHNIQTSSQAFHQHANRNQILFKPGGVLIGSRIPHF